MIRFIHVTIFIIILLALPGVALGVQRFPPPQFTSGHELPDTTQPSPRGGIYEYLDAAVLLAALSLASYLALRKRSRRGLLALGIFSLAYLGFWRKGCVCAVGSVQNVTLALSGGDYAVPVVVIVFFLAPLVFTLFFGRTFCASVCPLGAIQDVFLLRPVRVPPWLEHGLRMLAYVYLGLAVLFAATGSAFVICEYDPFVAFFRRTGHLNMLILGACFLLISMFIGRSYCRYLCPYGVLLGWMSRASKWHLTITPDKCIQCRLCEDSCPFGSIQKPTEDRARDRSTGKRRLGVLIFLLPVFIASGVLLGARAGGPLSHMNATVSLARRVSLENSGEVKDTTDASDAFRRTGRPAEELYQEALALDRKFAIGGGILGAFLGLVIGMKMIQLSVRRSRTDYQINPTTCVSCGRCIPYCPVGRAQSRKTVNLEDGTVDGGPSFWKKLKQRVPGTLAPGEDNVRQAWYRASKKIAVIGGVFSLIVCALLLINYVQIRVSDPLDSEELSKLKAVLLRDPKNDSLKEQIRALDLQLREENSRRREFSRLGSYLLIGGVAVFLIGARSVAAYRQKLPMPQPKRDEEQRNAMLARVSVGIFAILTVGVALALMIPDSGYRVPGAGSQRAASDAGYPTPEEIKKNWPRFRGPGGLGISAYTDVPSSWNGETGEGILWKTPIPLPGENSPIVWGDRVFLTGADEERREVYCFDANSGEMLWQRAVENIPFSEPEPPEVSEETGYAAPTAVTDGRRVYAIFANGDLICFDFDGNQIWGRSVGPFDNVYGHASSLAMYQNLVLVLLDQGGADDGISELTAVEATTGRTVWSAPRPVPNSWATPVVIDAGQREEIITCGNPWVIAYEPATGAELWRAECLGGDIAPSPVYADGLIFVTNTYEILAAIRPGGQGNVTETNIVWTAEDGLPDICSPLATGELVLLVETYGFLTCYDAKTGEIVWEEDSEETFMASPSLVGDNIYLITEDGVMIIIKADREYKEVGRCQLGEGSTACPAFMDGRIYIRGKENLYCITNAQK